MSPTATDASPAVTPDLDEIEDTTTAPEPAPQGAQPTAWIDLLQASTPREEVHQRVLMGKGGQPVMKDGQPVMLDYVTARFVQDRLDAAVGAANWQTMYSILPSGCAQFGIGIRVGDEWVWKWDVGVPSSIEPEKGAVSDGFKRAGVQWGIARDLYDARDDERLAPVSGQQPQVQNGQAAQQATGQPIRQQVQQQTQQVMEVEENPAWVCPLHDDAKVVPAGISRRTGRKYNAFYACPVAGCDQKGPSIPG